MKKIIEAMGKLFTFIGKALSDGEHPSATRVNIFIAICILTPCIAYVLVHAANTKEMHQYLTHLFDTVLVFLGSLFGFKMWQGYNEKTDKPKDAGNDKAAS
jgi:multisubunit Na+/H+ antiporter MnhG subunit